MDTKHPHDIYHNMTDDDIRKMLEMGKELVPLTASEARLLEQRTPAERGEWLEKKRLTKPVVSKAKRKSKRKSAKKARRH